MNKRLVTLLVCLALVIILIIVSSIMFTINDIVIETAGDLNLTKDEMGEIIYDSKIQKHSSVFGLDENIAISNIEKVYPELKVISIERKFPSKVLINIARRVPIIALPSTDGGYVLIDRELKAVDLVTSIPENYVCEVKGCTPVGLVQKGTFITSVKWLKSIVASADSLSFINERFATFIPQIQYQQIQDDFDQIFVTTNTGVIFVINNDETAVEDYFNYMYTFYRNSLPEAKREYGYICLESVENILSCVWKESL